MKEHNNSPIAQLVEQMTVNHWVRGSSPRRGAKFKEPAFKQAFFVGGLVFFLIFWKVVVFHFISFLVFLSSQYYALASHRYMVLFFYYLAIP